MNTTQPDILSLPASRELDALVGEKVMALPHIVKSGGEYWETAMTLVPPYSTAIAAAWEVVEKLGLFDEAHLQRNLWNTISWQILRQPGEVIAEAPTAPLAICRAALLAVGVTDAP